MYKVIYSFILIMGFQSWQPNERVLSNQPNVFVLDTFTLFDQSRQREIPVAIYKPQTKQTKRKQSLVILSHGYAGNDTKAYLSYSYLTEFLASKGYFVISIQHELSSDSLMPTVGIPQVVRRPFWERGAENILFVINQIKLIQPDVSFHSITLIGHSNGGDMIALFPQKYPNIVDKIISLDNRRMTLPRTTFPKIYSLRSSDLPSDEGVLPTAEESKIYSMKIVKLINIPHNNMSNNANTAQRIIIQNYILRFLKD